jgi:large subunit ribosomal protein L25
LDLLEIKSDIRKTGGKGPSRALRREGRIPPVLYGPKTEPMSLSLNRKELETVLKNRKTGQFLFNLTIENGTPSNKTIMIKELQRHPVSQKFLHADFYEVAMDQKIRVRVPVLTKGKSKGVEFGGMLQIIRRELEVLCFPNQVPQSIELDVTDMDVGDSIHVKEIPLADGVEIPAEVNFTVLTVLGASKSKAEAEEGEEEEGEEGEAKKE